jgi:hypothetical protein
MSAQRKAGNPIGTGKSQALRVVFDGCVKLELHLSKVISHWIRRVAIGLGLLCTLGGFASLHAQDAPDAQNTDNQDRDAALQKAFDQFPLLTSATMDDGRPEFQRLMLTNPVVVNREQIFGFRFTVPPRANHEDLVWSFVEPGDFKGWYIVPQTNDMDGFTNYYTTSKGDYLREKPLLPTHASRLVLQYLKGDHLNDRQTYLIWFGFGNNPPRAISVMFTFTNFDTSAEHPVMAFEKLLSLNQTASQPFVNPANHHTYILLRPANWEASESLAEKLGGHLATVRNQAEEDWIFKTFGRYGGERRLLWIGLTDVPARFHFSWADGESASYTGWARFEPDNAGPRGEDYVAINYPGNLQENKWKVWNTRRGNPSGLPMDGVVEIIPANILAASETNAPVANSMAVPILPDVTITNNNGSIKLEWPLSASDCILEATTNLSQPFAEFGYTGQTNIEAGIIYVIITNPSPQMFFLLKQP